MSLTSESARHAALALDRAAAGGWPEEELTVWRRDLDPTKFDLCGCHASLTALVATLTSGLAVQLIVGFSVGRPGLCPTVALCSLP